MRSGIPPTSTGFSAEEVEALVLGARWVADHADPAMRQAAHSAMARLLQTLPPEQAEAIRAIALFFGARDHDDDDDDDYGAAEADPASLVAAIQNGRRVSLVYRDLSGEPSERVIWPFAFAKFGRADVLLGWCELRRDYRTFRLDRIVVARTLAERYPRARATLLREWRKRPDIAHERFVMSDIAVHTGQT